MKCYDTSIRGLDTSDHLDSQVRLPRVEWLGQRTGGLIERTVIITAVIGSRLSALTLLGRETPESPAEVFFT